MPAGFQTFAPDGRLQIDSNCMMFGLVAKGSATRTAGGAGVDLFTATGLPNHQFAALSCTAPIDLEAPGSGHSMKTSIVAQVKAASGSSYTVTYYLFQAYRFFADPGFGLQAFNAAGTKIFDAAYPPLRVIEQVPITAMSAAMTDSYTVSGASGKTIAFMRYGTVERRSGEVTISEPGPPPITKYYKGVPMVQASSGGFVVAERQSNTRSPNIVTTLTGGVLALDVTNL